MIEIDSLATFEGTFVLSKVFSKVRKYESTSYVYLYSQAGQRLTTGRGQRSTSTCAKCCIRRYSIFLEEDRQEKYTYT